MLALLRVGRPAPADQAVLDLGTGDGRVLATVLAAHPGASGVAVDGSPTMLAAPPLHSGPCFARCAGLEVEVVEHDLDRRLPAAASAASTP